VARRPSRRGHRPGVQTPGQTDVIDLINNLPQNFQNAAWTFPHVQSAGQSGGVSTADLRAWAPATLVLVDGRRLGIADANTGKPEPGARSHQIPRSRRSRRGADRRARPTYGSDAVAGVVNFVMKHKLSRACRSTASRHRPHSQNNDDNIQGLLRAGHFGVPKGDVWDGRSRDLSVVLGTERHGRPDEHHGTSSTTSRTRSRSRRATTGCQVRVKNNAPFCNGSPNSNQFFQATGSAPASTTPPASRSWGISSSTMRWAEHHQPAAAVQSNPSSTLQHDDERYRRVSSRTRAQQERRSLRPTFPT